MPKLHDWPIPLTKNLVRSRKVKMVLMERVERLVRGGAIPRPLWYDIALAHPPPMKFKAKKKNQLTFPEDELRRAWLRRNPQASMHPKTLFLEQDSLPADYRQHPADVFVEQQVKLMKRGQSEEQAYRNVQELEKQAARIRAIETETAKQQAIALGAQPATDQATTAAVRPLLQQQILRQFAEEARDQGLPYPRHWFNADGAWRGIGASQIRSEMLTTTRKALDKSQLDSDLVRSMLSGLDLAAVMEKAPPSDADVARSVRQDATRSARSDDDDWLPER
eukprot:CAMPEP_0119338930 /NCGR_PEP_ID=MMETSP1333-20130426/97225_1 /TAXON_ID=418940 /ORGANISM="Scyphosphaera apsteinii, Strain RCC1455" /LENGTH=278 /DNA_ID=CAMNT_0007350351 /DNA_START=10 /DNA_END=846 /DNA_ORIENTATION=+